MSTYQIKNVKMLKEKMAPDIQFSQLNVFVEESMFFLHHFFMHEIERMAGIYLSSDERIVNTHSVLYQSIA
jgi:hypothetical protein